MKNNNIMKKLCLLLVFVSLLFCFSSSTAIANPTLPSRCIIASALGNNLVLDIYGNFSENGTNVQVYSEHGGAAQIFELVHVENEWYKIVHTSSGKLLDVTGAQVASGVNVQIYEPTGSDAQLWKFISANGGYYIQNKLGYYLDVQNGTAQNETNVWVWGKNGSNAQIWNLKAVLVSNRKTEEIKEKIDIYVNALGLSNKFTYYWNAGFRSTKAQEELRKALDEFAITGNVDLLRVGLTTKYCPKNNIYGEHLFEKGGCTSNIFDGGAQCHGFALYIEYYLHNEYVSGGSYDKFTRSNKTWEELDGLKAGDLIRCNGHSMVFYDTMEDGTINVLQCNGYSSSKACSINFGRVYYTNSSYYTVNILQNLYNQGKVSITRHKDVSQTHSCVNFNSVGVCMECGKDFVLQNNTALNRKFTTVQVDGAIHTTPYGDAPISGRLQKNAMYTVTESATNYFGNVWYKLEGTDSNGCEQWVVSDYLALHTCKTFDKSGYCKECKSEFALQNVTYFNQWMKATKDNGAMHTRPYGLGEINGRLITKNDQLYLVTQSAINSEGNLWYLVKDTDGNQKWVVSTYLKEVSELEVAERNTTVNVTYVDGVTQINAIVHGTVAYSASRPSEVGLLIGKTSDISQMSVCGITPINFSKNPFDVWYNLNEELQITLEAGTTYYYRMYALVDGNPVISDAKEFQTEGTPSFDHSVKVEIPEIPSVPTEDTNTPASTITLQATGAGNITTTNATVYGNASYTGSRPSEIGLLFGENASSLQVVAKEGINFSKNPFDIWYDLNKEAKVTLAPGRTYYYQLYAIVDGQHSYSNVVSFTTPANVSVWTTGVSNVTATNATVSGGVKYSGNRPTKVGLLFGTNPTELKDVASDVINFSKNPFDIWYDLNKEAHWTLSAGQTYYYQFYVIQDGYYIYSDIASFQN